ncbi:MULTISPECIES: hypothetical protein [Microbacterium]|uniref:hypothetical protein n=1 Tax=Microbacterium TaxID=33882 RepID=UPI0017FBFBEB|nr:MULTISPECIES: hypothetical protein [Microbacterium]MCC4266492.1 hypothetical protein [Microbacterium schleiferi]HIE61225.1 hypothetical protein [Microbacterium sp.]
MSDREDGFMDAGSPETPATGNRDGARTGGWHDWFDVRFRTPAAVYGLIVYSALLMITSDYETDVAEVVVSSVATLIVFFIAHVFAYTLADHGKHPLGTATRYALTHSAGMLWAAVPPTLAMVIAGAAGRTADDASAYALWVTMLVLAFLGYVAYSRTGAGIAKRILGATGTAFLGAFVAILEYAFH